MAIIISQVKTSVTAGQEDVIAAALKKAGLPGDTVCRVRKTSLDARDNRNIRLVSSVWAELGDEAAERKVCAEKPFCAYAEVTSALPVQSAANRGKKVVVAGFGPAGMFAALTLAEYGLAPVVIERGGDADARTKAVELFRSGAALDPECNVQFGEGGAGTFSDGKLTTRIGDPLCGYVLEKFVKFGAPEEILYKAKPHVGTDNLRNVVKALRNEVLRLGGQVRFRSRLEDISTTKGRVTSVTLDGGEILPCDALILAIGHSARDTFEMLLGKGIFLEPKPFSAGARIEHRQEDVNRSLYGKNWDNPALPAGEYQLSFRSGGRAVYTFCMCPGGVVVPAASESGGVVTNGMSRFARDGENANSALVVSLSPGDFPAGPLGGVALSRSIERKAFAAAGGNYRAPACTVGSFLSGGGSLRGAAVVPSYSIGVSECNFEEIFPDFVTGMMRTGLENFAKKMKCFGDGGAVLTAPETRTSSPVRITRGENMESLSAAGLFPCGEGAGYAGGIMSAAVDGIKCALKIIGSD